jgi:hypothetical protein
MTKEQLDAIRARAEEWKAHDIDGHPTPMNEDILALLGEVERLQGDKALLARKLQKYEMMVQYKNEMDTYISRLEARLGELLAMEYDSESFEAPPEGATLDDLFEAAEIYADAEMTKLRDSK